VAIRRWTRTTFDHDHLSIQEQVLVANKLCGWKELQALNVADGCNSNSLAPGPAMTIM
jgi:hypothetical protein